LNDQFSAQHIHPACEIERAGSARRQGDRHGLVQGQFAPDIISRDNDFFAAFIGSAPDKSDSCRNAFF
jgi:hypothetical protein